MSNNALESVILNGKNKEVIKVIREALDNGASPNVLINSMISAMTTVGDRFQFGEIMISDMLASAMTMKKGISFVTPLINDKGVDHIGKAIIGMAAGDLHDIGKGLVSLMLESVGFEVIDLGIDVAPDSFIDAINQNPDCKIVIISATLDTSLPAVKKTIDKLVKAGVRDKVKIIVGGTALSEEAAFEMGADGFAQTAMNSAVIAKELLDQK